MRVPHDARSAALVRNELAAELTVRGVDARTAAEAALVISELVGNAVRHTAADGHGLLVDWHVAGEAVTIQVKDHSAAPPSPRTPNSHDAGGRGLQIVAALAEDWGVLPADGGKCVWARVHVRQAAPANGR